MFYIKEEIDFSKVVDADRITIPLQQRIIHCTCPLCGDHVEATPAEIFENLRVNAAGTAACCAKCSKKLDEFIRPGGEGYKVSCQEMR